MSKQGVLWPKLAGCVIALMLLASTAVASPQLDASNPTNFFTNVAMAMFQQMDLHDFNGNLVTITNIPIYEDPTQFGGTNIDYYTPAVHRILQLAANLFDATTNRFIEDGPTNYPTVFRPIFGSQNGIVSIIGYQEVTSPDEAFLPMLNASDFARASQPVNSSINLYGVPWVIGAKKGFPNFNEFSMENPLMVSRKLSFTNNTGLGPASGHPWTTNQIYLFNITNSFGFEAWNSYTNLYGRPLRLVASNELSITVTNNETGTPLLVATNIPYGVDLNYNSWPGWSARALSDSSFKIPLYASQIYTNGIYTPSMVIPLAPPVWTSTFVPHLWMTLQFKLRFVLIDTSANRVVDFVNISSTQPAIDINPVLNNHNPATNKWVGNVGTDDGQWNTNEVNGTTVQMGILNQIEVSKGDSQSIWTDPQRMVAGPLFYRHLLNGGTNYFVAPYTPSRTIIQRISLQANDPLVHYTESDLVSTNWNMINYNELALAPVSGPPLANLTNLNIAYQPWGGRHLPNGGSQNGSPYDFDWRVKDLGVQQSDGWNFPAGESLSFEWLGRVHRGTPWQTVFLKFSNQTLTDWRAWNNDTIAITNGNHISVDAAFSHPTNDWRIASLWAQWLNTNDLFALLSINNTDTNAWAARLDGLTAFTNAIGELDPLTIASNSAQAGVIAQAIQTARANTTPANGIVFPNHVFEDAGEVLATRELSIASPFLNTNGLTYSPLASGISDEALEKIPTQLIPLLRADSFGKIIPANGQLEMSFSGYDGHAYAIEVSSNLSDWVSISTNYPSDGNFGLTNTVTSGQQFYRSVLLH